MSTLIRCPDCGKLLSVNFPIHACDLPEHRKPQPIERLRASRVYEITRKTRVNVRIKPYGTTNRAAVLHFTREDFERLFIERDDKTCIRREPDTLCEILK